jgi:prolyl-tRNA editing enzyme YbaK/EbsC (Cys-tRNA(Pro) deacylase)
VHRNVRIVVEAAAAIGLPIKPSQFPDGTRTAADAAAAIGVNVGQIVKSLVFAVGDPADVPGAEIVMAFVAGDNQLDERKLATAAGCAKAWRVDAETVRTVTGFPVGGVPPLGHATALRLFADPDLLRFGEVWAAAGTPHDNFALDPHDLVRVLGATSVELAKRP